MEIDGHYSVHLLTLFEDDLVYVITSSMRFLSQTEFSYFCEYRTDQGAFVTVSIPKSSVLCAVATI